MSHSHETAVGPSHAHTHARVVDAPRGNLRTLVRLSALDRIALAAIPIAALWLAIAWAAGWLGGTP